jgi:uncharacterized coiled-coil protein SlyX
MSVFEELDKKLEVVESSILESTENDKIDQDKLFGFTERAFQIEDLVNMMEDDAKHDHDFKNTKRYFLTYFANTTDNHFFEYEPQEDQDDGEILSRPDLKPIFDKISQIPYYAKGKTHYFNLKHWFIKEHHTTYKLRAEPLKPRFFTGKKTGRKYINLSKGFLHKMRKPFASYSNKVKKAVQKVLDHIKYVWNSGNDDNYQFTIKTLAHMLTGHKLPIILFLKSGEGTGKSCIIEFIVEHVIGRNMGLVTSKFPGQFNYQLVGKIFVCFEELPSGGKNDWHKTTEVMKDLATGKTMTVEQKYKDVVDVINMLNIAVNTNNDNAIRFGKDIRRYLMLDISHDKVGDDKYFKELGDMLTRETGEAFFMYLNELYESTMDFSPVETPLTESKIEMKNRNISEILKHIKTEYIAEKKAFENIQNADNMIKLNDLKDEINLTYGLNMSTQAFNIALRQDIPIIKTVIYGKNKALYIKPISHEDLLAFFQKKGFWSSIDEFVNNEAVDDVSEQRMVIDRLTKQLEMAKKKLTEMKAIEKPKKEEPKKEEPKKEKPKEENMMDISDSESEDEEVKPVKKVTVKPKEKITDVSEMDDIKPAKKETKKIRDMGGNKVTVKDLDDLLDN